MLNSLTMPGESQPLGRSLCEVVKELAIYPPEAFDFVQEGLAYTVNRIHGPRKKTAGANRHVTGQELCHGLLEFSLLQWGMLAGAVLERWNIHCTMDFGRIVFAMVENGYMQKQPEDNVEDFRDVFNFNKAFHINAYKIASLAS